jgi:hypothetical protein
MHQAHNCCALLLCPLQAHFPNVVLPVFPIGDKQRRRHALLLERGEEGERTMFIIPLKFTMHIAILYQMHDYIVTSTRGPENMLCYPGKLKQLVSLNGPRHVFQHA